MLENALSSETEKILGCIHCGLCLPACPTYLQLGNENDSPRGRIYLMRAVAEGRLLPDSETFTRHIDLCLGCRACETACPAGVNYGLLLESARHEASVSKSGRGLHARLLSWALKHIFPHPRRLSAVFAVLRFLRGSSIVRLAKTEGLVRSISKNADFALSLLLSTEPVKDEIAVEETEEDVSTDESPTDRSAVVLTGCVMAGLFKHINDATARVLAVNGCKVIAAPDQVCCGALHAHAGDLETARTLARTNIEAFEQSGDATIVVNAAGCGAMLKEYGHLLKDDPAYSSRAAKLSARVRDVSEFLVETEIRRGANLRMRVTYDAPCHLYHAQRVQTAPQQVLASIPGLDYRPLEGMQDCCGGAGIYNLSEPEMSERILSDKIAKVRATGADVLVTANPGCHMQLGAGLAEANINCRVAHVVELLDESYRAGVRG
jgi:glycolate dehydrogenase iron-sulfur subunit